MKKVLGIIKKDIMLAVSIFAAIISFIISPPSIKLLSDIDWKTLSTLFMLLIVLDGFKNENLFRPIINLAKKMNNLIALSSFLIFGVFFSSMFVTNDVSLIVFVPLTIILFRTGGKEKYTLPIIVMENIAAIRGSLITPFGSPQNLFLYSQSKITIGRFIKMMLPLWLGSIVLLLLFIFILYHKNPMEKIVISQSATEKWEPNHRHKRVFYIILFVIVISTIVTRTTLWPYIAGAVTIAVLLVDIEAYRRVDFGLLLTFLCFFIFASSISTNGKIAELLKKSVSGNEYYWSIAISQIISNVPASIVLWPFTSSLKSLIYGLDTAGLVSVIGSLASVINLRIYTKEYPGQGKQFLWKFEIISLSFFIIVFFLQMLFI